jgi:hypothetical protein
MLCVADLFDLLLAGTEDVDADPSVMDSSADIMQQH